MNVYFYERSDLACEVRTGSGDGGGIPAEEVRNVDRFRIRTIHIRSNEEADRLGKEMGRYVTIECGSFFALSPEERRLLEGLLAGELRGLARRLTGKKIGSDFSVLVAGLGNRDLTADAIGPLTVGGLTVTRHLSSYDGRLYRTLGCASVSAVAPGVLGQTGVETLELLLGAVQAVSPDLVLLIDALAAGDLSRLSSTVQLSDTGIAPGSGVGNRRERIDRNTLGVPVISIGVPTVVDSSTLVWSALRRAEIKDIPDSLREVLENGRSFFVSPKESDLLVASAASLLAHGIDRAFVGALAEG